MTIEPGDPAISEFDTAIALARREDQTDCYDATLDSGWMIGMGINGGLLLALAGSAVAAELGTQDGAHASPLAISAHYLSASSPGPAVLRTRTLRRGRTTSAGAVDLWQPSPEGGEAIRLSALATFGDLDDPAPEVRTSTMPPSLPAPEECVDARNGAPPGFLKHAALLQRLDLRLDPATSGWAVGRPSGRGEMRGWVRLRDGREPDPLMLLLAVDVLPPVTFDLGMSGWTPTLELTTHVRARPAPGWLRLSMCTRNLAGGLLEEDAEIWDSAGRLVAQSRQLARVPGQISR